jgi:hypothetical protein|tara:strand:- start:416 stop:649 length:234 start_codon:yes stop_codon:yes gene_type:complete
MNLNLDTITAVQRTIKRRIDQLKEAAIYSVDSINELQYVRGQIKSLEDLQQELKDLLNNMELDDDNVHGKTETDWET